MNPYITMLGTTAYALDSTAEAPPVEPRDLRPVPRAVSRPWRSARAAAAYRMNPKPIARRSAKPFDGTFAHGLPTIVVVPPCAGAAAGITPFRSDGPSATPLSTTDPIPMQPALNNIAMQPASSNIAMQSPSNTIAMQSPSNTIAMQSPSNTIAMQSPTVMPFTMPLPVPPLSAPVPHLSHLSPPSAVSVLAGISHRPPINCSVDDHREMMGNGIVYCPKCGIRVHFDSPVAFSRNECPAPHEREKLIDGNLYCTLCGAVIVQRERRVETKLPLHGPTAAAATTHPPSFLLNPGESINTVVHAVAQHSEVARAAPLQCEMPSSTPTVREAAIGPSETVFSVRQSSAGDSINVPKAMCYTAFVPGVSCGLPHCALCNQQNVKTFNYPLPTLQSPISPQQVGCEQVESKGRFVVIHNHHYNYV